MRTATVFPVQTQHLNDHSTNCLRPDLLRLAGSIDAEELHLDLVQVQSVSSAGLALFVSVHRQLIAAQKRLVLRNVVDEVGEVLRMTRLDTVLDVRAA